MNNIEIRPKTLIVDVDGCLLFHSGKLTLQNTKTPDLLPGVKEKFDEWDRKGYRIIIMSGRKESMRSTTETQLREYGLYWDQLILGVGGGDRILINDKKPNSERATAVAINLERNVGLANIEI
jgi:hypothetical protein